MFDFLCCYPTNKKAEEDLATTDVSPKKKNADLGSLSDYLVATIIRKMTPVAFCRSYRTCKWISSIVESNKKGAKIHLRGQLVLQFQEDDSKMLVKFQSSQKMFKRMYDFDEVLDSLARCSYFHLKSIWFPAANFDDGFFYLIVMHLQRASMHGRALSIPNCDYMNLAVEVFQPSELCIVGEEPLDTSQLTKESLQSVESIQFDCNNGDQFEEMAQNILPFCRQVKIFVNSVTECQAAIRKLIEGVQHGDQSLNCLLMEYNLQYNRLFKLSQLVGDLEHSTFELKYNHGSQNMLFFPIRGTDSYLIVISKLEKKFTFNSDLYEIITFTVIDRAEDLATIVARSNDLPKSLIEEHPDIAAIQETLFSRQ